MHELPEFMNSCRSRYTILVHIIRYNTVLSVLVGIYDLYLLQASGEVEFIVVR